MKKLELCLRSFRVLMPLLGLALAFGTGVGCATQKGTIGANLGQNGDGRLFIREVPPGLAAAKAGLQPGDEITLVNGRDVRTLDEKAIHKLLAGEVGETVKLTVLRGEQVIHVTLERTPARR